MPKLYTNLDPHELRSAVVGMVLGDLNLQIHGRNARAQASHTPKVRDYINLKSEILCQIPGLRCSVTDAVQKNRKLGKEYPTVILRTTTHPFLTELEQRVYGSAKQIDKELLNELTALGLALWYMDDGHLSLHHNAARFKPDKTRIRRERSIGARNIILSTHAFSDKENRVICEWLKTQWGIDARVKKSKGRYFYVYMNTENARKFVDIVRPFVLGVPSMRYKLDFRYKDPPSELERFNIEYWVTTKGNLKRRR